MLEHLTRRLEACLELAGYRYWSSGMYILWGYIKPLCQLFPQTGKVRKHTIMQVANMPCSVPFPRAKRIRSPKQGSRRRPAIQPRGFQAQCSNFHDGWTSQQPKLR